MAIVVIAGVNGCRFKVIDITASTLTGSDYAYGDGTGQYNKLANLYETYRLKKIHFAWRPEVLQALGSQGQGISSVDVAGGDGLLDFPSSIFAFSRSKNTQYHPALSTMSRSQDYNNWLAQALNHPFLRTINAATSTREFYQDDDIDRVPAILFVTTFTRNNEGQFIAGYIETNVQYQFRGRRLDNELLGAKFLGQAPIKSDKQMPPQEQILPATLQHDAKVLQQKMAQYYQTLITDKN